MDCFEVLSAESKTDSQIRKYVRTKVSRIDIKLQLDTNWDISIINTNMQKKIGKPMLKKTVKTARDMMDDIVGEM